MQCRNQPSQIWLEKIFKTLEYISPSHPLPRVHVLLNIQMNDPGEALGAETQELEHRRKNKRPGIVLQSEAELNAT
jgi:hypothetical protein